VNARGMDDKTCFRQSGEVRKVVREEKKSREKGAEAKRAGTVLLGNTQNIEGIEKLAARKRMGTERGPGKNFDYEKR